MPRPRTVDDAAVLAAAAEIIGEGGPSAATLAAVGARVGLSPATLVQRFRTKRGLLLELARQGAGGAPDVFGAAAEREASPLGALTGALVSLASFARSPEVFANHMAFLQMDLQDPEFHALALRHFEAVQGDISALLDRAVAEGELRPCDTRLLAETVHSLYNGALVTWAVHRRGRAGAWLGRELEVLLDPYRVP